MLQEPPDKLFGWQGHGLPAGLPVVFELEGHLTVVKTLDAAVGDGDPVNVASQVVENLVTAL